MMASKVSGAHGSNLQLRAASLFLPWFVGSITVLPFVLGLWVGAQGSSIEDEVYATSVGAGTAAVLLGLLAGFWRRRDGAGAMAGEPVASSSVDSLVARRRRQVGHGAVGLVKTFVMLVEVVVLGAVGWSILWWWFEQTERLNGWWAASVMVTLAVAAAWNRHRLYRLCCPSAHEGPALRAPGWSVEDLRSRAHRSTVAGACLALALIGTAVATLVVGVDAPTTTAPSPGSAVTVVLVVVAALVAPWLCWASDYSRYVVESERGWAVTRWVALGNFVPTVGLMVCGIVVANRTTMQGTAWMPDPSARGWADVPGVFGLYDAFTAPWTPAVLVPLTIVVLAAWISRVGDNWEAVLAGWRY